MTMSTTFLYRRPPAALSAALIFCLPILFAAGCEDKSAPATKPAAPAPSAAAPKAPNLDLQPTHPKPEYTLEVVPSPSDPNRSIVKWTAKVDSAGWSFKTESVLEEENNGAMWARAYVIISEPQPGDTIEKAPQTITGTYETKQKIDKAELSMKHVVRDAKPTWAPMYVVVKKTHDW